MLLSVGESVKVNCFKSQEKICIIVFILIVSIFFLVLFADFRLACCHCLVSFKCKKTGVYFFMESIVLHSIVENK